MSDFATESGHWYDKTGAPQYTCIGKNGAVRNTTLRDARQLGYYPSVTQILKCEAAPALERWKIQQACMACLTLPRLPGEDDDQFMSRALQDSQEQARKASDRGSYLHGLLENTVKGRQPETDQDIIAPVMVWLGVNFPGYEWFAERSFANDLGYGGKIDLMGARHGEVVVIDYKFKADIIPGKKLGYDNHCTQLAAYAHGIQWADGRALNLFISSTVPGLIVPIEWKSEELAAGWEAFQCLLRLWKIRRGL